MELLPLRDRASCVIFASSTTNIDCNAWELASLAEFCAFRVLLLSILLVFSMRLDLDSSD